MKHRVINETIRFEDLKKKVNSEKFLNDNKDSKNFEGFDIGNPNFWGKTYFGFNTAQELREIEERQIDTNNEVINSNKFDLIQDVQGSSVNMDAYLTGQPEDMFAFVHTDSNIIKDLDIFISLSGMIDDKTIENAGKKILRYIENKPSNVYFNINLISSGDYMEGSTNRKKSTLKVILSDSNSYLTNEVINLLCSPAMYRYYILKYCVIDKARAPIICPPEYINFMNFNLTTY